MLLDVQQCHFPPSLKQACYCTFKTCICKWTVMIGEHQHTGVVYWGGPLNRCWYVNVGRDMLMSLWLWCHNLDDFWANNGIANVTNIHIELFYLKSARKKLFSRGGFECTQIKQRTVMSQSEILRSVNGSVCSHFTVRLFLNRSLREIGVFLSCQ